MANSLLINSNNEPVFAFSNKGPADHLLKMLISNKGFIMKTITNFIKSEASDPIAKGIMGKRREILFQAPRHH